MAPNTPTPPGPIDGQGIIVLAACNQGAHALVGIEPHTGEEQWRVKSTQPPPTHSATVAVVWNVTSQGGWSRFRAIDRISGEELWASDTPLSDQSGIMIGRSPVAVLDEVLVVPTGADEQRREQRRLGLRRRHLAAIDGLMEPAVR